ncbi:MAG: molybdate ABC transporter substrate-binding protein [Phycisphaerales bacterium]|nr:molybdate ABC transporter substrate-binding protein [Phycisphaerales bacterium]
MAQRRKWPRFIAELGRGLLMLMVALCSAAGCGRAESPRRTESIMVLAAASLADAMGEVGAAFEADNPGVNVRFSFAGSNQLRMQLENGSPGDVFASADRRQMLAAQASGVVQPATIRTFAGNSLAIIVSRTNRAGVSRLTDLARPGVRIVVAADAVPAGSYTRRMLERAGGLAEFGPGFVRAFEANTVSREENVAAVVTKVVLDEADAGLAYLSDASGSRAADLIVLPLPPALEERAEYVAAVTARAGNPSRAQRFVEFLASDRASAILIRRGFAAPETGAP